MARLDVHLLGKLRVSRGGASICGPENARAGELLAYLLIHRDQPHTREALAGLLWAETEPTQSRKYLRQALWQIRAALDGEDLPTTERALTTTPSWVQANPRADLWVDVDVIERAARALHGSALESLDAGVIDLAREAARLYQADLLESCYQDWCIVERERLQNAYLTILDRLMTYDELQEAYDSAVVYGQRILQHDRAHERAHRRLMRLYLLAGDRTSALRQYARCVDALRQELDVVPSAQTVALYERIKADRLDPRDSRLPLVVNGAEPADPESPDVQLGRLRVLFTNIQAQVQQAIAQIDEALQQHRAEPRLGRRVGLRRR
jgi:DNA-binding SARP family transcriptional activator